MTRPSWSEYGLSGAEWASTRGDCRRSKVGAIIFDTECVVVASGFNGTAERGTPGCLDGACPRGLLTYVEQPAGGGYSNCTGIHAEANAIRWARDAGQLKRLIGSTIYITREPCQDCWRLIESHLVARAVWPGGEKILREGP